MKSPGRYSHYLSKYCIKTSARFTVIFPASANHAIRKPWPLSQDMVITANEGTKVIRDNVTLLNAKNNVHRMLEIGRLGSSQ
jgi:hypothetical protein